MAGELDDLIVVVGGDISPLQDALAGIPAAMAGVSSASADAFAGMDVALQNTTKAAQGIPEAFNAAGDAAGRFGTAAQEIVDAQMKADAALREAQGALKEIQGAYEAGAVSAQTLSRAQVELSGAVSDANPKIQQSDDQLKQLAGSLTALAGAIAVFQGVSSAIKDSLEAFGQLQKAEIALTALTGSATTAASELEKLKALSLSDALSFPAVVQAEQRMIALEIPLNQIPKLLQSAADSAAAMNSDFGTAVNMLDRFIAGGTIMARSVASLGINMGDLAKAMGTTTAAVTATFKSLDQSDRVEVLNIALAKLRGTSEATAKGLEGQWQDVQTRMLFALQEVGKALAPLAEQFIGLANAVIPVITSMAKGFESLPMPVQEFVGVVGGLTLVLGPAALAVGTLMKAFAAMGALEGINDLLRANAVATTEAGVAAGAAETKLLTMGTAMRALGAVTLYAAAAFAGWELGKWIDDVASRHPKLQEIGDVIVGIIDRLAPSLAAIRDAVNTVTYVADAAALAYINMAAKTDGLTISQRALTKEYEQQQIALKSATDKLREAEDLKARGLISDGQLVAAQDAVNKALYAMNPAAQAAAEAAKKLEDSIKSLLTTSNAVLQTLPTNLAGLGTAFEQTGLTVKSALTKIDSELTSLRVKMVEMGGATTEMLQTWGGLEQARDKLRLLGAEQAWTTIKDKIDDLSKEMSSHTEVTRTELAELAKYQQKLQDAADNVTKLGGSVKQLAKDSQGNWHEIVGPIYDAAAGIEVFVNGVKRLVPAMTSATTSVIDATGHIPALKGVTVDYGTAVDAAERGLREFSGDIVAIPPQAAGAAAGIQVLTGSTNDNATASTKAGKAASDLGTIFRSTADQAKIAAEASEGMARAVQNVAAAAEKAATGMTAALDASNKLSQSFKVTGFGGGPGGSESPGGTIQGQPGDVITQRGEAGQIISQNTVPGGLAAWASWFNSLFVTFPTFTHSVTAATASVATLSTAATQSASSLISAATSIANSLGGQSSLSAAQSAYQTAVDAYNKIAAFYQSGQATADQMRAAQDAVNAALVEVQKLTGPSGPFVLLSGTTGDLATATGDLTGVTSGLGIATNGLANTATTAAATIATAATGISDATAAAVNGINSVVDVIAPTIQAAAVAVSGINTLMAAVVPAVQAAAAVVLGVNSATLLPTHPASLPNVTTPSGPGGYNTTTMLSGGAAVPGAGGMTLNVNITGGGGAAIGREIINTVQAAGFKF